MSHLASSFTNFIKGLSRSNNSVHEDLSTCSTPGVPTYADGGTLYHLRHPNPGERPDPRKQFDLLPHTPPSGLRPKSPDDSRLCSPAKSPADISSSRSHGSLSVHASKFGADSGKTTASTTSPSDGCIAAPGHEPNRRRSSTFSGTKKRPGRSYGAGKGGSPRQLSPRQSYAASNAHPPIMSAYHALLLQRAFRNMSHHGDASGGKLIFKHLIEKRPEIRGLFAFNHTKTLTQLGNEDVLFRNHARIFYDTLRRVIDALDRDLNPVVAYLQEQARYHANFADCGLVAAHWDAMGEAMDECALEWGSGQGRAGPGRANLETNKAWLVVISFIVDTMRVEFERELRRRRGDGSRRNSGSSSNASSSVPPPAVRKISLVPPLDTAGFPRPEVLLYRGISRSQDDIYAPGMTARKYSDTVRLRDLLSDPLARSRVEGFRKLSDTGLAVNPRRSPRTSLLKTDFSIDRRSSLPNASPRTTQEIVSDFGLTIEHVD